MNQPFNGLSNAEAERLALIAEEAGEVVQAVTKILRHGYESYHPNSRLNNREDLESEIGDFEAAVDLLQRKGDVSKIAIRDHKKDKLERVKEFLHHQGKEG